MSTLLATIRTPALLIIGLLAPMRFRAPSTASEACNAIRNERVTERFCWKSILYEGSNSASGLALQFAYHMMSGMQLKWTLQ